MKPVRIAIIGGGLMGREAASAFGRWFVLQDIGVRPELIAVCDTSPKALEWFRRVETVRHFVTDYHELLRIPEIDVVYAAVPHNLHLEIYEAVLDAGKDLLAEKPFGIDLAAAQKIAEKAEGRFVRCSSEFPFYPGPLHAFEITKGGLGRLLQVNSGFWHSSDLDPSKPANWKRQSATCGEIGVMGDLGMHALHLPLRLGYVPKMVYAQLQKGYSERPDGKGGMVKCDTWDNAMLYCTLEGGVPMRIEMKRMAPGETNTWFFEALGTEGGVKYSTKEPKTLWVYEGGKEQAWRRIDLGFQSVFPAITGSIFEPGFPDCLLQMWASFLAERDGQNTRFGCATVAEAVLTQRIFGAALESAMSGSAIRV